MPRRFFHRHSAHKGETVNVAHDFTPYVNAHSTTLSSAEAQNIDNGIAIQSQATTGDLWVAQVVCNKVGNFSYELKGTMADNSIQILEFVMQVYDSTPTGRTSDYN